MIKVIRLALALQIDKKCWWKGNVETFEEKEKNKSSDKKLER